MDCKRKTASTNSSTSMQIDTIDNGEDGNGGVMFADVFTNTPARNSLRLSDSDSSEYWNKKLDEVIKSSRSELFEQIKSLAVDYYLKADQAPKGEINDAVGGDILKSLISEFVDLFGTSAAIYERGCGVTFEMDASPWCKRLRECTTKKHGSVTDEPVCLCNDRIRSMVEDVLSSGKLAERECPGGLNVLVAPIIINTQVIGCISCAYGHPPSNTTLLRKIESTYGISHSELKELASQFEHRPPFVNNMARKKLEASVCLIAKLVDRKRASLALHTAYSMVEKQFVDHTATLTQSYALRQDKILELHCKEQDVSQRHDALESVYAMATAFDVNTESMFDQAAFSISKMLSTAFVAIGRVDIKEIRNVAQVYKGKLDHISTEPITSHPCGIACISGMSRHYSNNVQSMYPGYVKGFPELRSFVGVPIFGNKGVLIGVIVVLDEKERSFTQYELHLLEIFARYMGRYMGHEIERKSMENQLTQAQEMKMLGQLTSGVAHEVRNPLNGILAITEALGKDLGSKTEYAPYIDHIRKQVTRLSDLMRDLLDFGRPIEHANLLLTPISNLITSSINEWHHATKHQNRIIQLNIHDNAQELSITVDRAKVEQVFMNLFENGCNHSPKDTKIVVDVQRVDEILVIMVKDQGGGINAEHFDHLFEPFFTTRKGGTGLGLCIVKRIVESYRGNIRVFNNPESCGATFELHFPIQ